MKLRPIVVTAATALVAGVSVAAGASVSAQAVPITNESYFFSLGSQHMTLDRGKGDRATITLRKPSVVRFTGTSLNEPRDIGVKKLLASLSWDPTTKKLAGPHPTATLSIDGGRSRLVEIRNAHSKNGTVTFGVTSAPGSQLPDKTNLGSRVQARVASMMIELSEIQSTTKTIYNAYGLTIKVSLLDSQEAVVNFISTSTGQRLDTAYLAIDKPGAAPSITSGSYKFDAALAGAFTASQVTIKLSGNVYNGSTFVAPMSGNANYTLS